MIVGSGMATYFIADRLSKMGHDVTAVIDRDYSDALKHEKIPFNTCCIPDYIKFMTGEGGFSNATASLYSQLKNIDFDVIHVFNYLPMLLFSLARELFDAPVVFTYWNTPYINKRAIGYYESSELDIELARNIIGLKKYNKLILGSKCSYQSALSLGANPKIASFKYHGIDIAQFNQDYKNNPKIDMKTYFGDNLKKNDILIMLPGRITERKGITESLYAISKVGRRRIKLLLTGMSEPYSQTYANFILEKSRELGISDQLLIPRKTIPRRHLPAIYARADIVLTPSYYEGLGFTAIEALALGRPLIATNVPGLNEVCNRENSILIQPRDSDGLAVAIKKILDNKDIVTKLIMAGPNSVQAFDMKYFVDYIIRQYKVLIKQYNGKS